MEFFADTTIPSHRPTRANILLGFFFQHGGLLPKIQEKIESVQQKRVFLKFFEDSRLQVDSNSSKIAAGPTFSS